jgi:hypothetical protein
MFVYILDNEVLPSSQHKDGATSFSVVVVSNGANRISLTLRAETYVVAEKLRLFRATSDGRSRKPQECLAFTLVTHGMKT